LPLAFSVSGILQFVLLFCFLRRQLGSIKIKEISQTFKKTILASLLMAGVAYFSLRLFDVFLETSTFVGIFLQTASVALVGPLVYLLTSLLLKSFEIGLLKAFLCKRFRKFDKNLNNK
jgi:putative peptidoglycan lipid II flippase